MFRRSVPSGSTVANFGGVFWAAPPKLKLSSTFSAMSLRSENRVTNPKGVSKPTFTNAKSSR